jgi:regulator of cell morphogenesis and NO signaling
MTELTPQTTVAEIVTRMPQTAAIFERTGIDFCCGGDRALAEVAAERGLDTQTLITTLTALEAAGGSTGATHDVQAMSTAQLVEHIVMEHHARTRQMLPMVAELLDTVVRVHGDQDASLAPMREQFAALATELSQHMNVEEDDLFPLCVEAESGTAASIDPALIEQLAHEHTEVGEALARLRELGGGYDLEHAHCNTHRRLLQSLGELEADLHLHIHEENNVLFPRTRAALSAA